MCQCRAHASSRSPFLKQLLLVLDIPLVPIIVHNSVSVLPTIRARQSEVNATADVGSSALLACDADGFPEPTVTWAQYVTQPPSLTGFDELGS